jgi:DNA-directed RNA polymerase specialized sigma24 family protein
MQPPSSDNRDELNLFARKDFNEIWAKVCFFVFRHFRWLESEMYVRGVILDTMIEVSRGECKKTRPPHVSLEIFLYQAVRNKIDHMRERRKKSVPFEDNEDNPGCSSQEDTSQQVEADELREEILKQVGDDQVLVEIVELWLQDSEMKPQEISRESGYSIEEIRNAEKRLRRRLSKLWEELRDD